ncbi:MULTISPECIES: hypothetical protein [Aphanothece]|uniref:hypothetical protein n=1 Tax=Aphanothece TaxID=1121 RepID=UPI003984D580
MPPRIPPWPLLPVAALLMGAALPTSDCHALRDRRDQVLREAMQAEIALLHRVRQRLCPREEVLASAANALETAPPSAATLDYAAYIRCRELAEQELQRTQPVLYRSQRGVPFYTREGERLARQGAGLQDQVDRACPVRPAVTGHGQRYGEESGDPLWSSRSKLPDHPRFVPPARSLDVRRFVRFSCSAPAPGGRLNWRSMECSRCPWFLVGAT